METGRKHHPQQMLFCLPFWVFPPSIHPSLSSSHFISSARLSRIYPFFWSHFSHSPRSCFPSSITSVLFFLSFHVCIFKRWGARGRWIETLGSVLVVFCVFNLLYQHSVLGRRVRKKCTIQRQYDKVRITSVDCLSNLFHFCIINYNTTRVKHELTS